MFVACKYFYSECVCVCVCAVGFFFSKCVICTGEFTHFLVLFLKSCLLVNVFSCEHIYVAVCVCAHACALIEEALGRESTINWATWINHAKLMRLKCVERQRREGIADHTHTKTRTRTHTQT